HFQHLTFVCLRPCGVENSTHCRNSTAFFPNDFANVLLCHPKLDDDCVLPLNASHMHFFWFLHNGPGNLLNQFLHGKPLSTDSTIGLPAQPPTVSHTGTSCLCCRRQGYLCIRMHMTGVWHLRDVNKYGMSVYGSRKGAPAQAIYTADQWRKGARFLPCFFL